MKKFKVAYFGTPDFSVPTLEILANHPLVELISVVSMPDRKAGRGYELKSPEVIEFSKKNKLPFFQTENINKETEFLAELKKKNVDLFIVLAFAQFLSEDVLSIPSQGCFNIHTSLLPKYRGAAPIHYALLNGDSSTGVSIQKMVKKMDAGDIALSQNVAIHPLETGGLLYTRLKFQAALSLGEFIEELSADKISFSKQDENSISFAPTLKREDGFLNFKEENSETLFNKVKALYPWPGTFCFLGKKRLKIISAQMSELKVNPGTVDVSTGELVIGAKSGSLKVFKLQLEGKKACDATELINGYKDKFNINP